ncbi:2-dehydro-3-deoxy-D-gluconate 5-dehydrogenase [bacterium HR24]|nr:2-dehydro-3-deoxy-D-gluconate 5-dehydrogenase [bacterium HR24]
MREMSLAGKVALVMGVEHPTGRAVAVALAEAGADVACVATSTRREAEVAANSCANEAWAIGRRALALGLDPLDEAQVRSAVDRTVRELGGLDVLVNAHDLPCAEPFEETDPRHWRRVLDGNLTAVYLAVRAAGKVMLAQGRGRIVNVVPLMAERGLANAAAYCAAKAGVLNLTRALALEWARRGVAINALGCGWTEGEGLAQDEETRAQLERYLPYRRLARPDELAGAALYLASDAADFITGQVIWVEGGALSHV